MVNIVQLVLLGFLSQLCVHASPHPAGARHLPQPQPRLTTDELSIQTFDVLPSQRLGRKVLGNTARSRGWSPGQHATGNMAQRYMSQHGRNNVVIVKENRRLETDAALEAIRLDPEKEQWSSEQLNEALRSATGTQTLLMVAGIEGSGHDLVAELLQKAGLMDEASATASQTLTNILLRVWTGGRPLSQRNRPSDTKWDISARAELLERAARLLQYAKVDAGANDSYILVGSTKTSPDSGMKTLFPYPFQAPFSGIKGGGIFSRANLVYPDLGDAVEVARRAGCRLRLVVLARHPHGLVASQADPQSSIKVSAYEEVQVVEMGLRLLQAQLTSLALALKADGELARRVQSTVVPWEQLVRHPASTAQALDAVLGSGTALASAVPQVGTLSTAARRQIRWDDVGIRLKEYMDRRFRPARLTMLWPTVFAAYKPDRELMVEINKANG